MPHFLLGETDLANVPVGFFQGKIGNQQMSVLGGDVLKRFNIILDSKREFMYLQENELSKTGFSQFK